MAKKIKMLGVLKYCGLSVVSGIFKEAWVTSQYLGILKIEMKNGDKVVSLMVRMNRMMNL